MRPLRIKTHPLQYLKSKAGWHEIAGRRIYFRSSWEKKYAEHLQALKERYEIIEWEHEPKTFWFEAIKRGVRSYLPDFRVHRIDGTFYWVEVKGYMDARSKTKLKRFKKYYPEEEIIVVDETWFKKHKKFMWPVEKSSLLEKFSTLDQKKQEENMKHKLSKPQKKIEKVFHEYAEGKLHSGSKKGPKVSKHSQATAIALSEARRANKKK